MTVPLAGQREVKPAVLQTLKDVLVFLDDLEVVGNPATKPEHFQHASFVRTREALARLVTELEASKPAAAEPLV